MLFYTGSSSDVLNAVRNQAVTNYRNYVPIATPGAENLAAIGAIIMDHVDLRNAFCDTLVNRVAFDVYKVESWKNPLAQYNKREIDYGYVVNEIFPGLMKPHAYDITEDGVEFAGIEKPDVRVAFHYLNTKRYYKVSISDENLREAFTGNAEFVSFFNMVLSQMNESDEYDDYQITKYMVAREIVRGRITPVYIGTANTADTYSDLNVAFRALAKLFTFRRSEYNTAGVLGLCPLEKQRMWVDVWSDETINVKTYAEVYHIDEADTYARKTLVDDWTTFDYDRLAQIITDDPDYREFNASELALLGNVKAVLMDLDYIQNYPGLKRSATWENGQTLYRNYWLHDWKLYAVSPYACRAVMIAQAANTSTITNVALNTTSTTAYTATANTGVQLYATVTGTGAFSQEVTWELSSPSSVPNASITPNGFLSTTTDYSASGIGVKVTSVQDPSKTATATVGKASA